AAPLGIEPLIDAGDMGAHAVFEVTLAANSQEGWGVARRGDLLRPALRWLDLRGLCPGPCRAGRVLAPGVLRCDCAIGWPIETDGERRAASAQQRAWLAWLGRRSAPRTSRAWRADGGVGASPDADVPM